MFEPRWKRVTAHIRKRKADAYVIKLPNNVRYLFTSHLATSSVATHVVIFKDGEKVAIIPALEAIRARDEADMMDHHIFGKLPEVEVDSKTMADALKTVLRRKKVRKAICDSPETVRGVRFTVEDIVSKMRIVKSPAEVALIRKAVAITDKAGREFPSIVRPGASEKEVAARIDLVMRLADADRTGFDTIVAAGPHSAYSHHDNTSYRIGKGDPVIIDLGAMYGGYTADMTRTVFAGGRPRDKRLRDIYNAVEEALKAATRVARPGVRVCDVDLAARNVVIEYGYGKHYVHSTGHGIGLEVHELPHISPNFKDRLRKGMVFTIEPGIYIPKLGGVRIENDVLLGRRAITLNRTRIIHY